MQQLLPLFDKAAWEAPKITSETTSHLEVQVTGIAVMVPGSPGSDPRKTAPPLLKLTPIDLAIQRAFSAVRNECAVRKLVSRQTRRIGNRIEAYPCDKLIIIDVTEEIGVVARFVGYLIFRDVTENLRGL